MGHSFVELNFFVITQVAGQSYQELIKTNFRAMAIGHAEAQRRKERMNYTIQGLCFSVATQVSCLLLYVDQGNRVAVNHADTVGLFKKRVKSHKTADILSSYFFSLRIVLH